ncbi:sporulation protein [Vibrio ostreicida]|uniref:sporulation protein n=1 Tax=Vibrio ostreicida TaxID=526588 RepID=UPI0009702199|nr:sporulation protein [Vibrio ostreicida]
MLGKIKASLGFGAAKVDTVLENMPIVQGSTLCGVVHIEGGEVEQQIDAIHLKLCTRAKVESDSGIRYQTFVLGALQVVEPFVINPQENKSFDFELGLDDETPITLLSKRNNQTKVWIETVLDIGFSVDPNDRDLVHVEALPVVQKVISGIEHAGFTMIKSDVEKGFLNGHNFSSRSGCYQEIEFKKGGLINNKEIELSFILDGSLVHGLAEVDRSLGWSDDQYVAFTLQREADDAEIGAVLHQILTV